MTKEEYAKKYNQEHKEDFEEWIQEHKEDIIRYRKEYNQKHKKDIKKYIKKYRQKHEEDIKKYKQEHEKDIREYNKEWRKNNPDKVKENGRRRRALKYSKNNTEHFTDEQFRGLKKKYKYRCLCCGKRESYKVKLTPDHIVSLFLSGSDSIDNIQPLCKSCNSIKWIRCIDFRRIR